MADDLSKAMARIAPSSDEFARISRMSNDERMKDYRKKGEESWDLAWRLLHTDGWKLEAGKQDAKTGSVHSLRIPHVGKIFRLEGTVDCSAKDLFSELVERVTDTPRWNPTVSESKIIQVVDECTDICYNASPAIGGGIISSRDFVNVRHWKSKGNITVSAGCAVCHPDVPVNKSHVRGETKPGGWVFQQLDGKPNSCLFSWLVGSDLKGWIPQSVVDAAFAKTLLEFLHHVQKRISESQSPIAIAYN